MSRVPTGRVKWYDAEKGFGFLAQDGGEDVYVRKAALPSGVAGLKPGQRVEFGMAEGRRGPQALSVRLVDAPPSVVEAARRPAEELHGLIEDMIRAAGDEGAARPAPRSLSGPADLQAGGGGRPGGGARPRRLTPRLRRGARVSRRQASRAFDGESARYASRAFDAAPACSGPSCRGPGTRPRRSAR